MKPDHVLIINLAPRESECIVCGVLLLNCKLAIPIYEDMALPDDWPGEWSGHDACKDCADAQAKITVPTPLHKLRVAA